MEALLVFMFSGEEKKLVQLLGGEKGAEINLWGICWT